MFEAEVNRIAGEIALLSSEGGSALRACSHGRARSWELRAAMSMARRWRDQGKPQQSRELLAQVSGWFTEGFNTPDLKEAKALLDELAS
jgi:predicted ATPase